MIEFSRNFSHLPLLSKSVTITGGHLSPELCILTQRHFKMKVQTEIFWTRYALVSRVKKTCLCDWGLPKNSEAQLRLPVESWPDIPLQLPAADSGPCSVTLSSSSSFCPCAHPRPLIIREPCTHTDITNFDLPSCRPYPYHHRFQLWWESSEHPTKLLSVVLGSRVWSTSSEGVLVWKHLS